jgi:hypothetical protein
MGAHKIAVIEGGRVVEEGSHSNLVEKGGIYAALVKKQTARRVIGEADNSGVGNGGAKPGAAATIDQLLDDIKKESGIVGKKSP